MRYHIHHSSLKNWWPDNKTRGYREAILIRRDYMLVEMPDMGIGKWSVQMANGFTFRNSDGSIKVWPLYEAASIADAHERAWSYLRGT